MIELVNLTKYYPTASGRHYVFRDLNLVFPDHVNIGVIGRNGAGKSTLIRLLGGLDRPSSGEVRTQNSISWLVGLRAGTQGALTARDNARFVCRLYGAAGDDMRAKIRFVEEFADIGPFFDRPLQACTTSMRNRFSFGLSMAFDFDYYLVDETLAAGDPIFRKKAQAVFREKIGRSSVIMASHNLRDIQDFCDVVIMLEGGQVTLYEDVAEAVAIYKNLTPHQPARLS